MEATEIYPLTAEIVHRLLASRLPPSDGNGHACRRRAARWPFPGTVELWIPEAGFERYALATCRNLSLNGLGVQADEELSPGLSVGIAVHQPEMSLHGRAVVRHCTATPSGEFLIGLQFQFE
jgi:hypothetical protein